MINRLYTGKKIDILYVIDNSSRELFSALLIVRAFSKFGKVVEICSIHNIEVAFDWWRPIVIIYPRVYDEILETLSQRAHVFILPSESGNSQKEQVLAILAGTNAIPSFLKNTAGLLSWGDNMSNWVLETQLLPKEKIFTTGHPATDHWMLPQKGQPKKDLVGFATTFRFMNNNSGGKQNLIKWIYDAEKTGYDGTYYEKPENAESWVHFEASLARVFCNVIEDISINKKTHVSIRPHPQEKVEPYDFLTSLSQGFVTVKKTGPISSWLADLSVLYTAISASAIDAIVRGVPVISVLPLINHSAYQRIPKMYHYDYYDYLWQLESIDQINEYQGQLENGSLGLAYDMPKLTQYIKLAFNYPRHISSSMQIAESIIQYLNAFPPKPWKPLKSKHKKIWMLHPIYSIRAKIPDLYLRKLYESESRKGGFNWYSYTYNPWDGARSRVLQAIVDAIPM